jgi:hypothetical protein
MDSFVNSVCNVKPPCHSFITHVFEEMHTDINVCPVCVQKKQPGRHTPILYTSSCSAQCSNRYGHRKPAPPIFSGPVRSLAVYVSKCGLLLFKSTFWNIVRIHCFLATGLLGAGVRARSLRAASAPVPLFLLHLLLIRVLHDFLLSRFCE